MLAEGTSWSASGTRKMVSAPITFLYQQDGITFTVHKEIKAILSAIATAFPHSKKNDSPRNRRARKGGRE